MQASISINAYKSNLRTFVSWWEIRKHVLPIDSIDSLKYDTDPQKYKFPFKDLCIQFINISSLQHSCRERSSAMIEVGSCFPLSSTFDCRGKVRFHCSILSNASGALVVDPSYKCGITVSHRLSNLSVSKSRKQYLEIVTTNL